MCAHVCMSLSLKYVCAYMCYVATLCMYTLPKSPCITCHMTHHMTMKYIMMYPSMVGSVQCDVPTKGCLLCVCVCLLLNWSQ